MAWCVEVGGGGTGYAGKEGGVGISRWGGRGGGGGHKNGGFQAVTKICGLVFFLLLSELLQ
jgi:hypothetical protein